MNDNIRHEQDFIGTVTLPADALWGISAQRAVKNFPATGNMPFPLPWFQALGQVKLACYLTYQKLKQQAQIQSLTNYPFFSDEILEALIAAAKELVNGNYFDHFIVPAITGGAGTSINMNVNEIITNLALKMLGHRPGQYHLIDPYEHANIFQSTNDVVPTALKVAIILQTKQLEWEINQTRQMLEQVENKYREVLRLGITQLQIALPSTYGRMLSSFADALARDWWRCSKCVERLKVVNLGGSAIGSGAGVPRYFLLEVTNTLREICQLPLARGENLADTTSNWDNLVEVSGMIKAHGVNLEKQLNDFRFLAADSTLDFGLHIPPTQVGSSIMPGKVNPVISEYIISCCHQVYCNDQLISSLAGQGMLELNAYLPLMGKAMLENCQLLINANQTYRENLLQGLQIDETAGRTLVLRAPTIATILLPQLGYHQCARLAQVMKSENLDIFAANERLQLLTMEHLQTLLLPEKILQLGFSLSDWQAKDQKTRT